MIEIIDYNDNFYEVVKNTPGKTVAYGLGLTFKTYAQKLDRFDILCDRNATVLCDEYGIVYAPKDLEKIDGLLYIVVFVKDFDMYKKIVKDFERLDISAKVTGVYDNCAFSRILNCYVKRNIKKSEISVNIVNKKDGWIFTKFAEKMYGCLERENVKVTISETPRKDVDLNHHIPYLLYEPYINDTLMITHVDCKSKVDRINEQLKKASIGICMSKDTRNKLISLGVPSNQICYINPAQDGFIKPKKYGIAITHRCYDKYDVRKRSGALLDVLKGINPLYFKFYIMGAGWEDIVLELNAYGFEVEYYNDFNYMGYVDLLSKSDYYLYMGFDEGSMGYLDAMAAGIGTIVTPQGYHLDTECPIDYPCSSVKEFHEAFIDLQLKREKKISAISDWSWENYTMKHLQLWKYILRIEELKNLYSNQLLYGDGIYSLLINNVAI